MQYRENPGNKDQLSILGYGCLRYSKKGTAIDQEKAEREMAAAVEAGVNYFDTAYTYGGSEACLGKFLAKGYRDKVKIATKLPHYYIKAEGDMERYFKEQLERLQTDHVEYYLMHMLTDLPTWEKLKKLGMEDWIREKKASGEIRNIGFSYHGRSDMFMQLIDAYDWDFCQIQYNYMDEHSQAGVEGLRYAHARGIPVIIMEPLRGGRLVNLLPESAKELFAHEFHGDGRTECAHSFGIRRRVHDGVRSRAGGSGAAGDHKARQGGMHRLRLLYAVPTRGGYPRDIPLLQCDVLRRKKVRPQGLSAVYGIPQESGKRLTVCGLRQMRAALSAAY